MKVISLLQPWATLVVMGAKKIETRSWNTKYRGPLIIHSSARKDKDGYALWHKHCWDTFAHNRHFAELPFGALIGQVELVGTCGTKSIKRMAELELDGVDWETELLFGDYTDGRFGWLMKDPVRFEVPRPAKGMLGIWEYPLHDIIS